MKKLDPNYKPKKDGRLVHLMHQTERTFVIPGLSGNVEVPLVDIGDKKFILKQAEDYDKVLTGINQVKTDNATLLENNYEENYVEEQFKKAWEVDEEYLFTIDDMVLNCWSLKTQTLKKSFDLLEVDQITSIALSTDKCSLWYSSKRNLKRYDISEQQITDSFVNLCKNKICHISMSLCAKDIYLCTLDCSLYLFNIEKQEIVKEYGKAFENESAEFGSMQMIANGLYIMISNKSGGMRCFGVHDDKYQKLELKGSHKNPIKKYCYLEEK